MISLPEVQVTVTQSIVFLAFTTPLCFYVAWNDLRDMKIPNWCTDALAIVFIITGIFVMPFSDYLWRYAHFGVVLFFGILLNAAGAMGGGDSKFLASAAPFIALSDTAIVFYLLSVGLFVGFVTHRLARAVPVIRNVAPDWASWSQGKRFPMGFAMGPVLIIYLAIPLF